MRMKNRGESGPLPRGARRSDAEWRAQVLRGGRAASLSARRARRARRARLAAVVCALAGVLVATAATTSFPRWRWWHSHARARVQTVSSSTSIAPPSSVTVKSSATTSSIRAATTSTIRAPVSPSSAASSPPYNASPTTAATAPPAPPPGGTATVHCDSTISAPASISAAENGASPGTVLCLRGGVYAQVVTLSHSGTAAAPITVTSFPGERAILDGSGAALGSSNGIVTMSGSYVTLSNVELRNSSGRGVSVTGTGDIVSNSKFHDMKFNGLIAAGTNEVIEGNEVWNTVLSNQNDSRGSAGWAEAMNSWQATNATFRNNYVHDNWGEGIDFIDSNGGTAAGNTVVDDFSVLIYVDGSRNIQISGNHLATTKSTFYRSSKPTPGVLIASESGGSVANITVTDNVLSHTGGISTWNVTPTNLVVSRNTIS